MKKEEIWLLIANDIYDQDTGDFIVGYTSQEYLTKIYLKDVETSNTIKKIRKIECIDDILKELDVQQNNLINFK